MRKFFVDSGNITDNIIFIKDIKTIGHITKVLRLRTGNKILISDSSGWEYECEISDISVDEIRTTILDRHKNATEPNLKVTLFQGIPKSGKMDDTVRKVTELGIHKVYPVFMDRTVVVDNGSFGKKVDRMQRIAGEASKQCKRGHIPEIHGSIKFNEMIDLLDKFDLSLFLYEDEDKVTLKHVLENLDKEIITVAIIIGPEGGFSEKEAEILKRNAKSASLGKTVLRTETAGVAALSMVMYALEMAD